MSKVLLYSGGMDSIIASHLCKPDFCLYIDVGGRYNNIELGTLTKPPHGELIIDRLPLGQWERKEDLILPQRNAYFALWAANYGDEILLGATYGDRSTDKDEPFAEKMNSLFEHIWSPQHWLPEGRKVKLTLPLKEFTKGELVKRFLDEKGSRNLLIKATSCYSGDSVACGRCKPCARKWVALTVNKINITHGFDSDPREYFTPEILEKVRKFQYRGSREDREILTALSMS